MVEDILAESEPSGAGFQEGGLYGATGMAADCFPGRLSQRVGGSHCETRVSEVVVVKATGANKT